MRVLQIDAGREMRGGQWQVLRLMEGLAAAGVEVTLAARAGSPLHQRAAERKLRVVPLGPAAVRLPAEVVHAHDAHSHALAAVLARAPVMVSRRVAFPIRRRLVSRWKYRRPAHYIAVSEFVKQGMIGQGIPAERISVVYDGVPLLPVSARSGRMIAPRPTRDKPAALYQGAGCDIYFSEDLEADLKTAALFVYMSESEGLGSGVLLALSAGVPVIASRTGGIPEIIRHEQNGLLVDNTAASLAAAVARLRGDPVLAGHLAARGRQTIEERFLVDIMVRDTQAIYRKVLSC